MATSPDLRPGRRPGLRIADLRVSFGGVHALGGVTLTIPAGGVHAVIGPNGAGKTSLINAVTGVYRPSAGTVHLGDADLTGQPAHRLAGLGITRTFQNLQIFWTMSVLDNVLVGLHRQAKSGLLAEAFKLPSHVRREAALRRQALAHLAAVGLEGEAERDAGTLPYGALKRLEIARALAAEPDFLFLDEPAAGCNPTETRDLGRTVRSIADRGVTVILVEHDMKMVMAISDRVLVLTQGRLLAEGTPAAVQTDPRVIEAYLGKEPSTQGLAQEGISHAS